MDTRNTEKRVLPPRPVKDFNTAKRLYMKQFGSGLVTNNYLLVALAGVSLVAAGLIWLNLKTHQTFKNFKPLVIRISDVGRAEALSYDSFRWEPQDAEIRYFLDGRLADATMDLRAPLYRAIHREEGAMTGGPLPLGRESLVPASRSGSQTLYRHRSGCRWLTASSSASA
jgi:hypothetical protein